MTKSLHKGIFLFMASLLAVLTGRSDAQNRHIEIIYICNAGYYVQAAGVKVLVDPFCRSRHYISITDSVFSLMAGGHEPFGAADILLTTHVHPDHFNDSLAAVFLAKQTSAKCISSSETCDSMLTLPEEIQSRLGCLDLQMGEIARLRINSVLITAIRLRHTGNAEVMNIAFLAEWPGCSFFHAGDAMLGMNEDFICKLPWDSIRPDLLFIGYYDRSPATLRMIREKIRPGQVVLTHASAEKIPLAKEYAQTDFPGALVFEKPMDGAVIKGD